MRAKAITIEDARGVEAALWASVDHSDNTGDCWPSRGLTGSGYGALMTTGRRTLLAHRVAWVLAAGEIPDETPCVLHICDNRACVRNDEVGTYEVRGIVRPRRGHLFLGTHADNAWDKMLKGRGMEGDGHYSRTNPEKLARGERHGLVRDPSRAARGDANGSRLYPERLKRGDEHPSHLHPENLKRGADHPMVKLTEAQFLEMRRRYDPAKRNISALAREFGIGKTQARRIVHGETWKHLL